jgi:ABC-2 type transport system ATP-binding protein
LLGREEEQGPTVRRPTEGGARFGQAAESFSAASGPEQKADLHAIFCWNLARRQRIYFAPPIVEGVGRFPPSPIPGGQVLIIDLPKAGTATKMRGDMAAPLIIETQALTKVFGKQRALDGVNLQVGRGAIGLLGPNGAGKSTFMKCLLQLQPISSGSAKLLGREVGTEGREIRKRVGYTPEQNCHIPGMVGCEYVTYCAQLCGLPFQAARQRAHEMLDFVGMGQERYRKIDTYSTGMKQRLKLAQAIVHDPEIVFLDEPTNGLDPKGQAQILELVQSLWKTYGITVVLSSHLLHDVDRICEQIIIIARGRVLVHDTLENLKARKRGAAEVVVASRHQELQAACERQHWASELLPNGHVKVEHKAETLNPLLQMLHELKLAPLEIIPSPNALEETFVQALEISHAAA